MHTSFDPDTLIIFTSSPTGLGHIRVMNALISGLAPGVEYEIIGMKDVSAAKIHALGSRIPILLKLTEFLQNNPLPEAIITKLYQIYFSTRTAALELALASVKLKFPDKKRWVIVSTHYALSYPVVAVKSKLAKKYSVEIVNALIVTDDSPQRVWTARGSDIIFAPSERTRKRLQELMPKHTKTVVETVSFPVSPRLAIKLSEHDQELLENQLDPKGNQPLHVSIPISGAAVQLDYLYGVVNTLCWEPFVFTVIGQESMYTHDFFEKLRSLPRVQISTSPQAHTVVRYYESAFYQALRPAVEITKPSEQTFKAILKPNEKGGVILLLSDPVGRQEYDNLNFLIRNGLLANETEQKDLERYLLKNRGGEETIARLHYRASHWRALKLPQNPALTVGFIKRAKTTGILHSMLGYIPEDKKDLKSDGVHQIWSYIDKILKDN